MPYRPDGAQRADRELAGMGTPATSLCHLGMKPDPCAYEHVAAVLPIGREGTKSVRLCPVHDDRKASLSINPGRVVRVVWNCGAECDPGDIRAALLGLGVDESCLGRYGLPRRTLQPGMQIIGHDPALVADAKRLHAIDKLPRTLNGKLYIMCVQAVIEGDGDLPPDPFVLLPVNADDFVALAKRSGIERRYRYELYKRWLRSDGA
jgi:hypothetical protein